MSMWWARLVNAIAGPVLASSAIRRSFVDVLSEPGCSVTFPACGSVPPAPASLHWVPRGRCPSFFGTTRRSDFLPSISPRFVAFALRYRGCPTCSLTLGRWAPPAVSEVVPAGSPRHDSVETSGSLEFPGSPIGACRGLKTPEGSGAPRHVGASDAAFRRENGVGTLGDEHFGARCTARCLAVYASLPRLPLVAQDSLPAGGLTLCRAAEAAGLRTRFHGVFRSSRSSSSELLDAIPPAGPCGPVPRPQRYSDSL